MNCRPRAPQAHRFKVGDLIEVTCLSHYYGATGLVMADDPAHPGKVAIQIPTYGAPLIIFVQPLALKLMPLAPSKPNEFAHQLATC